jgi:L-seryl-tRNA(Ser) seleniumtransferase
VDQVLSRLGHLAGKYPRSLIVSEVRRALDRARAGIKAGATPPESLEQAVEESLARLVMPTLRRVINATGVILHTNLGRAPLPPFSPVEGYCNLEYDLAEGRRGKRDAHASELLERLLGKPAIVVNNNAAAVYLALHELAGGGEVIVSRGELIEIGDGFRIPDIMAHSGATLREVGATNRTTIEDYRAAIGEKTCLLLRVHPSNFRMEGFTGRPVLGELAALGRERGIPVYEDLGSGCVADLRAYGIDEPLVRESLENGVSLVSFSGDKLLGGPQAGILAGDPEIVARLRRNPMYRALRMDKVMYQVLGGALSNLLLERYDDIPALRMIRLSPDELRRRAEKFLLRIPEIPAEIREGRSIIGGGSTPEQWLRAWLIAVRRDDPVGLERRLRLGDPPVIARIEDDLLLFDLRTVFPEEEAALATALQAAC